MAILKPVKVFSTLRTGRIVQLAVLCMLGFGVVTATGTFEVAAQSSNMQSVVDRLNRLERDFNDIQRQVYRGETPKPKSLTGAAVSSSASAGYNADAYAILSERLDQLEAEQRNMTGPLEEANFKLDQMAKRLDKLVIDVDFRLTEIERKVAGGMTTSANPDTMSNATAGATINDALAARATPSANQVIVNEGKLPTGTKVLGTISANPQPETAPTLVAVPKAPEITVATPAILPPGSPQEQYNFAIGLVRKDQFDAAQAAFNEFLEKHKEHALAGNAQYWLGETYYVRGDYPNAASSFLAGYQNYPDNAKVADNLLKLAMSLNRMDQKEEACAAFVQMDQQFTKLPSRLKRMVTREKAGAGCK